MKKKMKTCAFTGHRPQNLPFGFNEEDERCIDLKKALREQIINLIENEGVTHFISGMAIECRRPQQKKGDDECYPYP